MEQQQLQGPARLGEDHQQAAHIASHSWWGSSSTSTRLQDQIRAPRAAAGWDRAASGEASSCVLPQASLYGLYHGRHSTTRLAVLRTVAKPQL